MKVSSSELVTYWVMMVGKLSAKSYGVAILNWKTYSQETVKKGGPIPIQVFFFSFVLANNRTKLTFVAEEFLE